MSPKQIKVLTDKHIALARGIEANALQGLVQLDASLADIVVAMNVVQQKFVQKIAENVARAQDGPQIAVPDPRVRIVPNNGEQ